MRGGGWFSYASFCRRNPKTKLRTPIFCSCFTTKSETLGWCTGSIANGPKDMRVCRPQTSFLTPGDEFKRLNIGYLAPAFGAINPVTYFIKPILEAHDHERFAVTCYSDSRRAGSGTRGIQELADRWRDVSGETDQQVITRIRKRRDRHPRGPGGARGGQQAACVRPKSSSGAGNLARISGHNGTHRDRLPPNG